MNLAIGSCDSCGAIVMLQVDGTVLADNSELHSTWHENPGFKVTAIMGGKPR